MNCYKCKTPIPDDSRFCSACGAEVSGEPHVHPSAATLLVDQDSELFAKLQTELGSEYVLERELGRGGMAVVYLGRDTVLGRKVAVKVLPPELTFGGRGALRERFKREAQTAAKLDHPNIIPVYRVAQGGTLFWYAMKYLDGETLERILERERMLALERTADIVWQVGDALQYAHQSHVIHRDVKPANVVIDARGRVTVTDFGIAKALDANTLTASGTVIGTPYYMSPEQCRGLRVGAAADQYSLAVMTYQMLGGHLPFTGETAVEIVHKQVADPVPPLGFLRPQLPVGVIDVVERGLAKAPEHRFPTVAEFARRLKEAAEGHAAATARAPAPAPGRAAAQQAARDAGRERARRRRRLVVDTLAAALLAAGAAATLDVPGGWTPVWPPGPDGEIVSRVEAPAHIAHASHLGLAAALARRVPWAHAAASRDTTGAARTAAVPAAGRGNRAVRIQAAQPSRPPAAPARPVTSAAGPPRVAPPPREAARADTAARAAPAMGWISLGTNPRSTISVNDTVRAYPVVRLPVPAGAVRLHFTVMDESGTWTARDTTVMVAPGALTNLHYLRLVHP